MPDKIEIPEYTGEPIELEALGIRYGFRYDPMEWVNNDRSVDAALIRRNLFGQSLDGDREILDARIEELLAALREGPKEHGDEFNLPMLLEMGCPSDRPEFRDLLDRQCTEHLVDAEFQPGDHRAAAAIWAACEAGWQRDDQPAETVARWAAEVTGQAVADNAPWAWGRTFRALWAGRRVVDTRPAIELLLNYLRYYLNLAGCLIGGDPSNTLGAASIPEHPLCRDIVALYIPMILRSQQPDGSWGGESAEVYRALLNTGFLPKLLELPPLPPEWRVVRSVPAPEGRLLGLTWDGARFWTMDRDANEALAISPEDGAVVRRLKITPEGGIKVGSVAWYDDSLIVTAGGSEHHGGQSVALVLDPDDGSVRQTIPFDGPWGPNGAAQVGDELLIAHYGWLCVVNPKTGETHGGHNPAAFPRDVACDGETIWVLGGASACRMDLEGMLLEATDKPAGGEGMTYDGRNLWSLNNEDKRICIIEKTE